MNGAGFDDVAMRSTGSRRSILVIHPSDLLTDHLPHGDGLLAHAFISGLARRGHKLHVALPERSDLAQPIEGDVELHHVVPDAKSVGLSSAVRYVLGVGRLLRNLDRHDEVDVAHQLNPVRAGMSLGMLGTRVPLVLGPMVGNWVTPGRSSIRTAASESGKRLINAVQQRRADGILLSTPVAESKLAVSSTRPTVGILPPGVDADAFSPARTVSDQGPILFVGRLIRSKGVFDLLQAFAKVLEQRSDARLVLAGDGPDRQELQDLVTQGGLTGAVEFVGPVARDDLPELMRAAAVLCAPSHGEPFGLSVLEAMSCGRPVVGTAAGGLVHLIPSGGGFLVPPGDATALAAALTQILREPELAAAMGVTNRNVVLESFAWPRVIDRLEAHYDAAIQRAAAVRGWRPAQ